MENEKMQDATPSSTTALAERSDVSPATLPTPMMDSASAAEPVVTPSAGTTQLDRDQILDATWQCLREQGYDATTIRRIAASLGCAIGSIYRYYRDKHDLLSCVTQRPYEAVLAAVEEGQPFASTAGLYAQLAAKEPQSYFLMFWLANQKLQGASQAEATFQLPPVIQSIIDGWAKQVGGSQNAMQRWAVLHGAMTAGTDPLFMLQSMGLIGQARQVDPDDRTAQQIVTVMRTPPLPRHLRQMPAAEPSTTAASPVNGSATPQTAAPSQPEPAQASVRQREDVCLL